MDATLQLGMIDEVAGRQRLLDHQPELVESREEGAVRDERSGVGVDER